MSQHCQWLCCSPRRLLGSARLASGMVRAGGFPANQEYSGVAFFNLTVGSNRLKGVRSASGLAAGMFPGLSGPGGTLVPE